MNSYSSWPSFDEDEIQAVAQTIRSNRVNYWTGNEGRAFETEFARWVGCDRAIALTNGTVALDLALRGLDVQAGDEVIVTPRTFIASVSSVINCGAVPVFADVDLDSGNITPESIAAVTGPRTWGILPVHLGGWPADMPAIMDMAASGGYKVIEDCAQAHGATIAGRSVGSFGDVGAWSFCQDKIMTTGGEGGMVTTNNHDLWDRMWSYKDHGKNWDSVYNKEHAPGFRWVHDSFGTNWRMLEIQSVIGRLQLSKLAGWTERRTTIAHRIEDTLSRYAGAVRVPRPATSVKHAYYRQYAYVNELGLKSSWSRDRILAELTQRGVPAFQGTCSEVYLEKAFDGTPFRPLQRLPNALALGATSLMFLTHPSFTDDEIDRICNTIDEVMSEAGL